MFSMADTDDTEYLLIVCLALSIATNAVTIIIIAYKLWYVTMGGIHWIQQLMVK